VAETGLELTLAYIRNNNDWRSAMSDGTWVSNHAFGAGAFTIVAEDGRDIDGDGVITNPSESDGDLTDGGADPLTLTVTGKVKGRTHVIRAVLTPIPAGGATMIVYGEQNETVPRCRTWTGSEWTDPSDLNDIDGGVHSRQT
jgi:hypothetical protein